MSTEVMAVYYGVMALFHFVRMKIAIARQPVQGTIERYIHFEKNIGATKVQYILRLGIDRRL